MNSNAPWLSKKEWANNQISSKSKLGLFILWGVALVWNLISLPILLDDQFLRQIPHAPEKAIALLFPLVGFGLIAAGIHGILSWRKFSKTPLTLDPFPGSLGGHLGGCIDTNIPYEHAHDFKVSALCVKSYVSGSGKNRSRKEKVLWQTEGVAFTAPSSTGTALSFRFELPSHLPESDVHKGNTYYLWRVQVACELDGADFDRQFEVPVFKGMRTSETIEHGTEDFHKTVDQAHESLNEITRFSQIPGGMEAYYPALTRPAGGIFALLFGSVFFGIGVFLTGTDAALILPLSFTLIGAVIALFGLWDLGKSLRVTVTQSGIKSRRYFLGYPITTKHAARETLKSISIKEGASMNSGKKTTIYYSLVLQTQSGQKQIVAERLTSKPETQIMKETIETYSGMN